MNAHLVADLFVGVLAGNLICYALGLRRKVKEAKKSEAAAWQQYQRAQNELRQLKGLPPYKEDFDFRRML